MREDGRQDGNRVVSATSCTPGLHEGLPLRVDMKKALVTEGFRV